jgi:hypothetical protein
VQATRVRLGKLAVHLRRHVRHVSRCKPQSSC